MNVTPARRCPPGGLLLSRMLLAHREQIPGTSCVLLQLLLWANAEGHTHRGEDSLQTGRSCTPSTIGKLTHHHYVYAPMTALRARGRPARLSDIQYSVFGPTSRVFRVLRSVLRCSAPLPLRIRRPHRTRGGVRRLGSSLHLHLDLFASRSLHASHFPPSATNRPSRDSPAQVQGAASDSDATRTRGSRGQNPDCAARALVLTYIHVYGAYRVGPPSPAFFRRRTRSTVPRATEEGGPQISMDERTDDGSCFFMTLTRAVGGSPARRSFVDENTFPCIPSHLDMDEASCPSAQFFAS